MTQYQKTLKNSVKIYGIEPFGGKPVKIIINPAAPGTGIVFKTQEKIIPADLEHVESTKGFAKLLVLKKDGRRIFVPEHLRGELFGYGLDNALVELETTPSLSYRFLKRLGSARNIDVVPYFGRKLCEELENNTEETFKIRRKNRNPKINP